MFGLSKVNEYLPTKNLMTRRNAQEQNNDVPLEHVNIGVILKPLLSSFEWCINFYYIHSKLPPSAAIHLASRFGKLLMAFHFNCFNNYCFAVEFFMLYPIPVARYPLLARASSPGYRYRPSSRSVLPNLH